MKEIDIEKTDEGWRGKSGGQTVRGTKAKTKADTIRQTAAIARRAPEPVSVKIHKENGRFQEERTYPSSADPHKSKG